MTFPSSPAASSSATGIVLDRFETPTRRPTSLAASLAGRPVSLVAAGLPSLPAVFAAAAASSSATTSGTAAPGVAEGSTHAASSPPPLVYQRRFALHPPLFPLPAASDAPAADDQGNAGHKRMRAEAFGGGVGAPVPAAAAARGSDAPAFGPFGSYKGIASPAGMADDTDITARAGAQIRRKVEDEAAGTGISPAAAPVDNLASPSPRGSADLDDSAASRLRHRRDLSEGGGLHVPALRNPRLGHRFDISGHVEAATPFPAEGGGRSPPRVVRVALGVLPGLVRVGSLDGVAEGGGPLEDLRIFIPHAGNLIPLPVHDALAPGGSHPPVDLLARFNDTARTASTVDSEGEGKESDSERFSAESAARTPHAQGTAATATSP